MLKKTLIFLTSLLLSTSYGEDLSLKSFLSRAKEGDYIVAESMKMFTLIRVRACQPQTIVLEEISAPSKKLPSDPWETWLKNRAPGHSSWSILELSLNDGKIQECYSFSKNAYIQLSQKESLMGSLLLQPLTTVPEAKMKKVGPAPLEGEVDVRNAWRPPFIFEGQKRENASFDVYETSWPEDGSELGGRRVTFYFDRELKIPLPIWIEVETSHVTGKIRVIDSGKGLPSPLRKNPKKVAIDQVN